MIRDATIEVECDKPRCEAVAFVDLPLGRYGLSEDHVARALEDDEDWTVDGTQHFCPAHGDDDG